MFPYINREVKTSFRFYRRAELRTRILSRCKDHATDCVFAQYFPNNKIVPFQILAGTGADVGNSVPTAWVIKDLNGNEVQDLGDLLNSLQVLTFVNPDRDQIILEEETLISPLAPGNYEMEITTPHGVYYSETFKVACGLPLSNVITGTLTDCANWTYSGGVLIAGVVENNGELPGDPEDGDAYMNEDDNLLYTWDGNSFETTPLLEDTFYSEGPCEPWYIYDGAGIRTLDDGDAPVLFSDGMACIRPGDIGMVYDIGADVTEATSVTLTFTVFWGSTMPGSLAVIVDGVTVVTINQSINGQGQEISVVVDTDSTVTFNPTADFQGCLMDFSAIGTTDGTECLHKLTWRNCGDVGTVRYKANDFKNILYIHKDASFIGDPTPVFKLENDTDEKQADQQIFARKDVDWTFDITLAPWYLIDALSEIPLLQQPSIAFQVAGEEDEDEINTVRIESDWEADKCLARARVMFRVEDESTASGCCDSFEVGCLEPCVEAAWVRTEHGETEDDLGEVFLMEDGTYATYWGNEQEEHQVDLDGFGAKSQCPSRYATTTQEGFESVYWTGEVWFPAVYVIEAIINDPDTGSVTVSGNVMAQFGVRIQYSADGDTWTYAVPNIVYSSSEIGSGVDVIVDAQYVRLELVGADCTQAFSMPYAIACDDTQDFANIALQANTPSPGQKQYELTLRQEDDYDEDWEFGGVYYKVNGGAEVLVTPEPDFDTPFTIGPFDSADVITVILRNAAFPGCDFAAEL